ncbi:hypothetical protein [Clostridium tagluense]|uniref:hypothetical protein n=1 Tax=Clostridium tagluense TaxID=360422 RepID=UPI001C6EF43B|nr:hypothetical protein [Clostridium tagluense]MBW9155520.1 hypothetical protein [Clostridium tagluense]WLC66146.1 hypothetical protein KTC93_02600 [Clostridium tagluense]
MRSEISLKVLKFSNENEKEDKLWDIVKIHKNEKVLVYVYRIGSERGVERFAEKASEKGYNSIHFHGEMTATERQEVGLRTLPYFEDEEIQLCLPYYLNSNFIFVDCDFFNQSPDK